MKELDTFIKIVVVGDSEVGKTNLLSSFVHQKLPDKYEPTIFENLSTQFVFNGIEFELSLWDTSGKQELRNMRIKSYANADVFIICYAVDDRSSLENVKYRWLPELRRRCPGVPRLLLGLKTDLRHKIQHPLTPQDGEYMQFEIQAPAFFEHSNNAAETSRKHLSVIFREAVRLGLQKKIHFKKNSCSLQ